ncbi:MAG: PQQ-like beta-propeller repeat protein, partial [Planctomycetota bacterium]
QTDWPKFRGVNGDGVAVAQDLSPQWGEDGPPELWRMDFGSGFSTVASVGDRLYTMGAPAEEELLFSLDVKTGKTVWQASLGARFDDKFGDGPRSTPTIEGDMVFAVSSRMHLGAFSANDGEMIWQKDLIEEFGLRQPRYGFSSSVLVIDDQVILQVGAGEGKSVAAFDRESGEMLIFNRPRMMSAISLDGELLWTHEAGADVISMAEFVPPDKVLTSSALMGQGGVMLKVSKTEDGFTAEKAWVNRRFRNHFNNSVHVDGDIYGFDNSTLRCLDAATGDIAWSKRGFGKGSLIACRDLLFVLGDQGALALVAADGEAYRELGRVQAMEGRCWTSPTLASGRLFVRNLEEIVAYDVSAPVAEGVATAAAEAAPAKPVAGDAAALQLEDVLQRYAEARGGLERWREVETLEMEGIFTAFSESGPFTIQRRRDHLWRFEYSLSGQPDARGRDSEDLWWRYHRFRIPEAARVELEGYHWQMKRDSQFEPALLGIADKDIEVKLLGPGTVDAQATVDLELTFPEGAVEFWRLHAETFLEVAVDSIITDMNQAREPMELRVFYSDFREVDGLVLPFKRSLEFGARLEVIDVTSAKVNPELGPEVFEVVGGGKD